MVPEGTRSLGFKGSRDPPQNRRIKMLKNYKELKVWQKSYGLCLEIYNNSNIPMGRMIWSNLTKKKSGCFYSFKYS
jgi:hypothetical protein